MSKLTRLQKFLLAIGAVLVITLGFLLFKKTEELTISKTQFKSVIDTLTITKNKLGQVTASRASIAGDLRTTRALLALAKAPKALQDMAKDKNVIVGVVGQNTSSIDTTVSIKNEIKQTVSPDVFVVNKSDSTEVDSTKKIVREDFTKTITNEWYTETVVKKGDSLSVNPKFVNKYEDKLTKNGDVYTWTSKNLSPYTSVQEIRTFNVIPPKVNKTKIFLWGGATGVAATVLLKVFVLK